MSTNNSVEPNNFAQQEKKLNSLKKTIKLKRWIIGGGFILLVSCLVVFNWGLVNLGLYYIFTADHFKEGDKMYITESFYASGADQADALRLIRPSKQTDIDTMNVNEFMRETLKKEVDTTLKPFAKYFSFGFDRHDMVKQNSAFIGTFVKASLVNAKSPDGKIFLTMMYIIKPNKKVFHTEDAEYKRPIRLPQPYTLANDNIYVYPTSVSAKELKTFSGL
ncbi:hypothetical protein [Mucilaginibacter flavus]|uniref:hypothetical protein n=1 Tax=Mucilaginibacter flavus TaxID=931504 RepID=UPI0025B2B91B|nr:hypothetical protein [Mucilaginibacter flavus]MDN3582767.1 hypothetical protein [Mucilaginibacter flavus]